MTDFITIMTIAFVTQLALLPGEKGQFVIAGLSTRYSPLTVVGAASLAFGGWTALEIWVGDTLHASVPGLVLDGVTAVLFLFFAALLISAGRSEPRNYVGIGDSRLSVGNRQIGPFSNWAVPGTVDGVPGILLLVAASEFGDKTQLITIGLAVQYGATPAIWFGEMLAIVPISLLNAFLFHRCSHLLDGRSVHYAAATLFILFGSDRLLAMVTGDSLWEAVVGTIAEGFLSIL